MNMNMGIDMNHWQQDPSDISKTLRDMKRNYWDWPVREDPEFKDSLKQLQKEIDRKEKKEKQRYMRQYLGSVYNMTEEEAKNFAISILEVLGYNVALNQIPAPLETDGCPYCASEYVEIEHESPINLYQVKCQNCGMASPQNVSKEKVVEMWKQMGSAKWR